LRPDDAGGRSRFQHPDALGAGLIGLVETAGRLHDQERAAEPGAADVFLDLADVAAHLGPDIGVGHHGRAALELAIFLAQLMRGRHEQGGMARLQNHLGARLVIGPGVAIEEQDGAGLDAEPAQLLAQPGNLALVERPVDLAVGQHPLLDFEPQCPLDQRHVLLKEQVVGVRPVDAADLVDVAKSFGDHERGAGAGSLQHRVDRDRRAVQEQARRREVAARLGDACVDAVDQPVRRRQRLAEDKLAGPVIEDRDVRKRPPDIGRKPHARAGRGATRC
jgi:hypothetical protein